MWKIIAWLLIYYTLQPYVYTKLQGCHFDVDHFCHNNITDCQILKQEQT